MFNENSAIVQAFVRQIQAGYKTLDQVPRLSNLKEMVEKVLGADE